MAKGETIVDEMLTVLKLGSGYAAVHMVEVKTEGYSGTYWDIQQTGIGRYATHEEAAGEARGWSTTEEIRLELGGASK